MKNTHQRKTRKRRTHKRKKQRRSMKEVKRNRYKKRTSKIHHTKRGNHKNKRSIKGGSRIMRNMTGKAKQTTNKNPFEKIMDLLKSRGLGDFFSEIPTFEEAGEFVGGGKFSIERFQQLIVRMKPIEPCFHLDDFIEEYRQFRVLGYRGMIQYLNKRLRELNLNIELRLPKRGQKGGGDNPPIEVDPAAQACSAMATIFVGVLFLKWWMLVITFIFLFAWCIKKKREAQQQMLQAAPMQAIMIDNPQPRIRAPAVEVMTDETLSDDDSWSDSEDEQEGWRGGAEETPQQSRRLSDYVPMRKPDQKHNEICPICYETIELAKASDESSGEDDNIRVPPCGHAFHKGCIEEWVVSHDNLTCPACRGKLVNLNETQTADTVTPIPSFIGGASA